MTAVGAALAVQPVPSAHAYVQRACAAPGVRLLPDPPVPGAAAGVWWPPTALRRDWWAAAASRADVVHVHFGFEQVPVDQLRAWQQARIATGVPLVVTVHDLRNPHHADHDLHHAQLAALLAGADAVLTLTAGAADQLRAELGVGSVVVPHPHVVELERIARPRGPDPAVVGLDLGTLRANVDAVAAVQAVTDCAGPGRRVRISVRSDALAGRPDVEAALTAAVAGRDVEVVRHRRRSDAELWDHLQSLTTVVLPYAWGTHSGWLEACWDLGTPVVAPGVGHYSGQHAEVVTTDFANALPAALDRAAALPRPDQAARAQARRVEAVAVRSRHAEVYAAVVAR